jgi:hypothetical protein
MASDQLQISVLQGAWQRAGSRCECMQAGHEHEGRCGQRLFWGMRESYSEGGWFAETRHGGTPSLSSVQVICAECKRKGRSIGF